MMSSLLQRTERLIDCMVFNAVLQHNFSYIIVASAAIHAFLEFFQPALQTILFPSHWLLSHITIVETIDTCCTEQITQ